MESCVWMKKALLLFLMLLLVKCSVLTVAINWGDFSSDNCVLPGYRKHYARLWNIKGDWDSACKSMPATVLGTYFSKPDNCVNKRLGGMWGEFYVVDSGCNPHWGSFKDDGCSGNGLRQYSSVLYDVQGDWIEWCSNWYAIVQGVQFFSPSRCKNTRLNVWGEFDVEDSCCATSSSAVTAPLTKLRRRLLASAACGSSGGGDRPPFPNNKNIPDSTHAVDAFRDDPQVLDLAKYFWGNIFQVSVSPGSYNVVSYNVVPSTSSGIRFNPGTRAIGPGIGRVDALVVPMISADNLMIGNFPQASSSNNGQGWVSLNLNNPGTVRVIATSQLSGCCFSMGWDNDNRVLYMGHAQPNSRSSNPAVTNRANLANYLRTWGGFSGVNLPSSSIFHVGGDLLGYGDNSANILGLISANAIFFIIQEVDARRNVVAVNLWEFYHRK